MKYQKKSTIPVWLMILVTIGVAWAVKEFRRQAKPGVAVAANPAKDSAPTATRVEIEDESSTPVEEELLPSEAKLALTEMGYSHSSVPREGDVKALKELYQKAYDLKIKELHRDASGGYTLTVEGSAQQERVAVESVIEPERSQEFRTGALAIMNSGRSVEITERDKKEIDEFRRAWAEQR